MQGDYVSRPGPMSEGTLEFMKKQEPFRGKERVTFPVLPKL